ncbi:MAG: phosphoribosyl-AMP cyclohydrolase [Deltaproteobacteria bacterium]|nr:phosphoribosyl-AMP cyclohydrolase [Deltaproteobacteria bacterium]
MKPDFSKHGGLIPVIVQSAGNEKVLMLAYMNELAWNKTVETGKAHFWSRSRQRLWLKGEESGHTQLVREILVDCDLDTILLRVEQLGGAACHTGYESCFHRRLVNGRLECIAEPIFDPKEVYKK